MIQQPFKDKLLNYEVTPPIDAWAAIADELLTSNDLLPLSKKLSDYEVAPPVDAWTFISKSLLTETELPSGVLATYFKIPLFKVIAAAAILGVLITGGLYLSHLDLLKDTLAVTHIYKADSINGESETKSTATAPITDDSELSDDPIIPVGVPKARKSSATTGKELRNTKIQQTVLPRSEMEIMIAAKPIRNASGEIIQNHQITNYEDNQYISITGPNGQQTKISSKFLNMLLFINDDSDIDQVDGYFDKNFLESLIWKSRFQDWRNKIISTSFVPSSANFMDILEFKDLITKDKEY